MRIKYIFIFFAFIYVSTIKAQQLANSSHINESRVVLNPATTAFDNYMIVDGFFRMQWLGFSGAPITGFASFQYPLNDYNMSAGALLNFDKTGPLSKTGIQLNYAYKLKELLSGHDQLSIGISGSFQHYAFNPENEIYNDENDPLIISNINSTFFPSAGIGINYTTNTKYFRGNSFYTGLAVNQIFASQVVVNENNQARVMHFHFNAGGRLITYNSFVEPSITVNLVNPDILDVLYSLKYEMEKTFWCGIGYASSGTMAIQGGIILDKFSSKDSNLRIGALANYGVGSGLSRFGSGYELYIGYHHLVK